MPCTLLVIAQILSYISVMPCMLESLGMLHKVLCTWPESDMQPFWAGSKDCVCCSGGIRFCPGRDAFA